MWLLAISLFLAEIDLAPTKELIQKHLIELKENPSSEIKKELAIAYLQDQDEEKAFRVYLEALDSAELDPAGKEIDPEDKRLSAEALRLYLSVKNQGVSQIAEQILQDYREIVEQHPEYYHLAYFVAGAEANLNQFSDFFERFYQSYRHFPDHYMAYKTKAILHTKLFMRGRTLAEREEQRQPIIENAWKAVEKEPCDHGLYRLIVQFSKKENQSVVIEQILKKIIEENIILSRQEIIFYVGQARSSNQEALANQLLIKALEWYPQSRLLENKLGVRVP